MLNIFIIINLYCLFLMRFVFVYRCFDEFHIVRLNKLNVIEKMVLGRKLIEKL